MEKKNPPYGHVNKFNFATLKKLFPEMTAERVEYVGSSINITNFVSAILMDWAGNPYGTYAQIESCIHCGEKLVAPISRRMHQKILTKFAALINKVQLLFVKEQVSWIHVLFKKDTLIG